VSCFTQLPPRQGCQSLRLLLHEPACYNQICKFSKEIAVFMARVCEVCGRGPRFGHRISHAHNVSKRRWNLNLHTVRAVVKGATRRLRVCTSCIRSGKIKKAA